MQKREYNESAQAAENVFETGKMCFQDGNKYERKDRVGTV